MNKIKTLVAHNNEIIKLKPEMVFTEYNFNNMNGLEIMKKSKETLKNAVPIFNMIVDEINDDELQEAVKIMGNKLNALVRKPYNERVIGIMNDYIEYINGNN